MNQIRIWWTRIWRTLWVQKSGLLERWRNTAKSMAVEVNAGTNFKNSLAAGPQQLLVKAKPRLIQRRKSSGFRYEYSAG